MNQAAEPVHVAGVGGVEDGPGPEEQQPLECGVVQGVVERRRERLRGLASDDAASVATLLACADRPTDHPHGGRILVVTIV